jgi:hypothetical protein
MEFDLAPEDAALVCELLNNWGPWNMTTKDEDMLARLASAIENAKATGVPLKLNI